MSEDTWVLLAMAAAYGLLAAAPVVALLRRRPGDTVDMAHLYEILDREKMESTPDRKGDTWKPDSV